MKTTPAFLVLFLAASALNAVAQFPLPIPTRPSSFSLQRPSEVRDVVSWSYGSHPDDLADVVQVAAGDSHTVALKSDGTVQAWGASWAGQTTIPPGLSDVVQVAAGGYHTVALKSDGTVQAWGASWAGQTTIPPGLSDVVQVTAGDSHTVALNSNGTVQAWGDNESGQTTIPPGLFDVVQVTAGGYHTVALKSDGTVQAWGDNGSGQTTIPLGLYDVVQVSAGYFYSVALGRLPVQIAGHMGAAVSWAEDQQFAGKLVTQGTAPYSWEVISGALPEGLALGSDGFLSGTPTAGGIYSFTVRVTDALGDTDSRDLIFRVIPTVAIGGGYAFRNLAGALNGTFTGSSFTGSVDECGASFSGSADGTGGGGGFEDGNGTSSLFRRPSGIAVDTAGNIYVSDSGNHAVRKLTVSGDVTTLAGSFLGSGTDDGWGEDAQFSNPQGLACDSLGNIYVAESGSHRIRKVTPLGLASHYAGQAGFSGSDDGTLAAANFHAPSDVAVDANGNIYVADSGNHAIRKIAANGTVTTWAGTMGAEGDADGTGTSARFRNPQGVAVDAAGNVYVADTGNSVIRKISPTQVVTTYAGAVFTGSVGEHYGRATFTGSECGTFFGSAEGEVPVSVHTTVILPTGKIWEYTFNDPTSDPAWNTETASVEGWSLGPAPFGNIRSGGDFDWATYWPADPYDNDTGRWDDDLWVRTTVDLTNVDLASVQWFLGVDNGYKLYVNGVLVSEANDEGGNENRWEYKGTFGNTLVQGVNVIALALEDHGGSTAFDMEITGSAATFSHPTDVEVDTAGNLYVTDSGTSKIRKIDTGGTVTTLGDTPAGFFYKPLDIAVGNDGVLFVADTGDNRIAFSFDPVPEIALERNGVLLENGFGSQNFAATLLGETSPQIVFTVRNVGYADLDSLALSPSGTDAGDFTLSPLAVTSLAPGESADFAANFAPSAGGTRHAQVAVASNDPDDNPFLIALEGYGISCDFDWDADGLNDEAEYRMSSLGFDWETAQPELVGAMQSGLGCAGYYTTSQIQAMNVGMPLLTHDSATGEFELTVELRKSTDLQTFQPFSFGDTTTIVAPDGRLKIRFAVPDDAAFFRLQSQ